MNDTEILLTAKDFEDRYKVARSNVYNRLNGLKDKGYPMEPIKQGNRSLYSADQGALMDRLHEHLLGGHDIASFPDASGRQVLERPTGHPIERPVASQDSQKDAGVLALASTSLADAIVEKVALILAPSAQLPPSQADPLANLRVIEEAHTNGWLLSTSQLAPLLGVKSLTGKEVKRYGYTFTREGKNGAESAWRISK